MIRAVILAAGRGGRLRQLATLEFGGLAYAEKPSAYVGDGPRRHSSTAGVGITAVDHSWRALWACYTL
jgi:CTP:molybdopterin cytidylyltransferase MocA